MVFCRHTDLAQQLPRLACSTQGALPDSHITIITLLTPREATKAVRAGPSDHIECFLTPHIMTRTLLRVLVHQAHLYM